MLRILQNERTIWSGSYESAINSGVRTTVSAGRYAQKFVKKFKTEEPFKFNNTSATGSFFMSSNGEQTIVGGCGTLLQNFLDSGNLSGYVGQGQKVSTVDNVDYYAAPIRLLRFDQSFSNLPYDVTFRESFSM